MMTNNKAIKRFMDKIKFFEKYKCWEWSGAKNPNGYGLFYYNKKLMKAHRFSLMISKELSYERLLGGHVLHKCDNPCCVNPDHLFVGTQQDNMIDKIKKRRDHNLKKTHCSNGHLLDGDNLIVTKRGNYKGRACRTCRKTHCLAHYYRNKDKNKEKINEKAREYYYKNIEENRRKSLERYHRNKSTEN